jgi:hypothetical protein
MPRRIPWARWAILSIMVLAMAASLCYRLVGADGRAWQSAINNDGKGYYEYLRAPLVEGRLDGDHGEPWMFAQVGDRRVIKYFAGTALFQAPFVLVAHLHTLFLSQGPEDGYSLQYHLAIVLASWFSLLGGLWCTRKLLLELGYPEAVTALVLLAITLGTGLLVQAVVHPGMAHVHAFAMVAALYLATRRALAGHTPQRWLLVGLAAGMVFIIRPVDVLALAALPLVAVGVPLHAANRRARNLLALALGALLPLLLQSAIWKVQCGEWSIRPYAGEGFHWDRPALSQQLFSARNGLFFYWPVLLLVLPGLVVLARRHPLRAVPFILGLAAFAYVTSAWWNWSYGDSFGQRPYVGLLAMLALPMAAALGSLPALPRYLLIALLVVPATALNLFQSWQYATGILVPARMDLRTYRFSFLRTTPGLGRQLGGIQELPPYAPRGMDTVLATRVAWWPDSTGAMRFVLPGGDHGEGWWHWELGITRSLGEGGTAEGAEVVLHAQGWPGSGVRTKLEHLPGLSAGTVRWRNALNLPPQAAGDTLLVRITHGVDLRIDSLELRVWAPR